MEDGSNLNDVAIETRSGDEWVRMGCVLFRPQVTVPALAAGSHTVTIGNEGYGECSTQTSRRLRPATVPGSGDAAYLLVHGTAGAAINLTVA